MVWPIDFRMVGNVVSPPVVMGRRERISLDPSYETTSTIDPRSDQRPSSDDSSRLTIWA
jgi:hypothetical protein